MVGLKPTRRVFCNRIKTAALATEEARDNRIKTAALHFVYFATEAGAKRRVGSKGREVLSKGHEVLSKGSEVLSKGRRASSSRIETAALATEEARYAP